MKLMSYAEINDLENGQQITALTGRVKKVFDQLTDTGQYGQWWLQSFIMTDEHGVELKCTWSGQDTVNSLEGKEILIESGHDKKEQLAGVKKEIKNKNGKHYETVKLDERCKIKTLSGVSDDGEDSNIKSDVKKSEMGTDQRTNPSPAQNNSEGVTEARKHIMQSANLYVLCVAAVESYCAGHFPQIAQTSEMFQAATGTLFIEASRAGLVAKMPTSPVHKDKVSTTAQRATKEDETLPF